MSSFRLDTMGAWSLRRVGASPVQLADKELALLAYLRIQPARYRTTVENFSAQQLSALLWPGKTAEQQHKSFSNALSNLRNALGSQDAIVQVDGRYALHIALSCDTIEVFEAAADINHVELRASKKWLRYLTDRQFADSTAATSSPAFATWTKEVRRELYEICGRTLWHALMDACSSKYDRDDVGLLKEYQANRFDSLMEIEYARLIALLHQNEGRGRANELVERYQHVFQSDGRTGALSAIVSNVAKAVEKGGPVVVPGAPDLHRLPRKQGRRVFVAAPMKSLKPEQYLLVRQGLLDILRRLRAAEIPFRAFCAHEHIASLDSVESSTIALEKNLFELRHAGHFLLLHDAPVMSSALVETGVAMERSLSIMILARKSVPLPFLLQNLPDFQKKRALVLEYENLDDAVSQFSTLGLPWMRRMMG